MNNDEKLIVRNAILGDAKIIYDLSNDVIVRNNSINKQSIKWEDHINWFQKKLLDDDYVIYLAFLDDKFVGQTKFEITSEEAIVSISIHEAFRGMKIAPKILKMTCARLFSNYKNIKTVFAYIKPENLPSIRSFQNAGFIKDAKEIMFNGEQFLVYIKKSDLL